MHELNRSIRVADEDLDEDPTGELKQLQYEIDFRNMELRLIAEAHKDTQAFLARAAEYAKEGGNPFELC